MKHILLFGAGKSATVLIDYLKTISTAKQWKVTVAENNLALAYSKVGEHESVKAVQINIEDEITRKELIQTADIVISMMPPALHYLIALDCILFKKHLLTASYADEKIKQQESAIKDAGILFLCEMGLDPGIDHMSAMQMFNTIRNQHGKILSFKSHCGGLVAPENDDNPWHYKISWNPGSVVMAGKAGAIFKEKNEIKNKKYELLFNDCNEIEIKELGKLSYYPNRDSLSYMKLYHLENAETFIRTTLRYPDFCRGWQMVIDLQLTDEERKYQTDHLSLASFFKQHFKNNKLSNAYSSIRLNSLLKKQFENLGLNDHETMINKGLCSAADVLQFVLETKWALQKNDKDMIVMLHEIEYELNGQKSILNSELMVKGENNLHTAMAKTVGLPLGIAAKLILEGTIKETGLHIPVLASFYEPVLKELKTFGITFKELVNH